MYSPEDIHTLFMAVLCGSSPSWKQPKCPSTVKQKPSCSPLTYTGMRNENIVNTDESPKFNIGQRKPDRKKYILFSYMEFKTRKTHLWFQKSGQCSPWGKQILGVVRDLLGHGNILFLGLGPGYLGVFTL